MGIEGVCIVKWGENNSEFLLISWGDNLACVCAVKVFQMKKNLVCFKISNPQGWQLA